MCLNFIISDDNRESLNSTEFYVRRFITENNMEANIALISSSPQEVISYSVCHSKDINVYILDINFNEEVNGLEIASNIRENEPFAYIVFLTAYPQLSMLTFKYKIKAFDFLSKPIKSTDIEECIKALRKDYENILQSKIPSREKYIIVKSGYHEFEITINKIIYIESFGPKFVVHMKERVIQSYGTLKEIETVVSKSTFHRAHKSFIINLNEIKEIRLLESELTMSNGKCCPIARSQKQFFKEYMKKMNMKNF
jgi:two-component system, LytTR family, response regulator AgrA